MITFTPFPDLPMVEKPMSSYPDGTYRLRLHNSIGAQLIVKQGGTKVLYIYASGNFYTQEVSHASCDWVPCDFTITPLHAKEIE